MTSRCYVSAKDADPFDHAPSLRLVQQLEQEPPDEMEPELCAFCTTKQATVADWPFCSLICSIDAENEGRD